MIEGIVVDKPASPAGRRRSLLHTADDIERLGSLITKGGLQPEWLSGGLCRAVLALSSNLHLESQHPSRKGLKGRLEKLQKAASQIVDILDNDVVVLDALGCSDPDGLEAIRAVWHSLVDFEPRIDNAAKSIRKGRGKDKHYPRLVSPPHRACAEIVCVAWKEVHGTDVPYTASGPQDACDGLWRLAGDKDRQHSSADLESTKGWRDQLRDAQLALTNNPAHTEAILKVLRPRSRPPSV